MLPFAASLGGQFVYDDHALIEQREAAHSLSRLPELWQGEFWQGLAPIHFRYLRPLVSTSYAIDWALYGKEPTGFHATNLLLHALVAFLLFGALRRWSKAPEASFAGAFVVTLAWAWHPSKVEAVSWIAGRTDLLAALGILVACTGVRRRLSGSIRSGAAIEALGMLVAFASKEIAVVLPAFVFVEAWAFYGRPPLDRVEWFRLARVALPHAAIAALYVAARLAFLPIVPEGAGRISFVDARFYTLETLGEFTRIVFFPSPLSIQRAPIRVDSAMRVLHDRTRLALGVAAVALLLGCIAFWRKRPASAWRIVGCLLGAAALLPVSNVVSARMVFLFAERFAYVPLIGFALSALPAGKPKAWSYVPWVMVLAASAALSAAHTRHFLDDASLWAHELAVNPKDPLALRYACEEAMRRRDHDVALDLAVRGYQASVGWPVPRADRVEFAARAARSLELTTLDADRRTLAEIADFYGALVEGRGTARLDALRVPMSIDAGGSHAATFREDRARVTTLALWTATVSSRIERCDTAVGMARRYLAETGDAPGKSTPSGVPQGLHPFGRSPGAPSGDGSDLIAASLVLARCSAWDEALDIAHRLELENPDAAELGKNIAWARGVTAEDHASVEGALRLSRSWTLLLQRGRAFAALVPFRNELVADQQGAVFFARAAWAAGEDEAARQALGAHMSEPETAPLLANWSRELGR